MSEFGFKAKRIRRWGTPDGWWVSLPHQCDRWEIAGDDYGSTSQEQAVSELERFIAEAQRVLERLKNGVQYGLSARDMSEEASWAEQECGDEIEGLVLFDSDKDDHEHKCKRLRGDHPIHKTGKLIHLCQCSMTWRELTEEERAANAELRKQKLGAKEIYDRTIKRVKGTHGPDTPIGI